MSDTPETDALVENIGMGCEMVDAWFSRKLERERDEAREENLEQARLLGISGERETRLIAERDELLKKLQRLAKTLEQADEEYGECIGGKADMLSNAIEEATK